MIKLVLLSLFFYSSCFSQIEFFLCETNTLNLKAEVTNGSYYWLSNGYFLGENDISIDIIDTGIIIVELVAYSSEGCEEHVKKIIRILDCENLFIPNSFTPNDDGINDFFGPVTNIKDWDIEVYDRWGGLIYKGTSPWSGNGVQDVYIYKLKFIENKKLKLIIGRVTLII